MNKKQILAFTKLGILFLILAVLFGIIVHTGANHPPLRYPSIGEQTSKFIINTSQDEHKDACINQVPQGPFKWENEKDLGQNDKLGIWSNEADHDVVVYYRRDKDAEWQAKAQSILLAIDDIAEELSLMMGRDCFASDSLNGRKLPIYLPQTEEEYNQVLENLCNGKRMPTNKVGSSVINIGPLGCKNEGIVIHPDAFKDREEFEYTLRKEMARYAYLSSVDYNEQIEHQPWFTSGLVEMFAQGPEAASSSTEENSTTGPKDIDTFTDELVDMIAKEFTLTNVLTGFAGVGPKIGLSFLNYLMESEGNSSVNNLVQESLSGNLDSAFEDMGLDFDQIKNDWVNSLR